MAKGQKKRKKSDDTVSKLMRALENGLSVTSACRLAKVARNTFYLWLNDDDFRTKIEYAENRRIAYVHQQKKLLIEKLHRPAIKFELKSKRPEVYGDKEYFCRNDSGGLSGNIKVSIVK